jgi:uncharacterized membrane protein
VNLVGTFRTVVLVLATLSTGLLAGLYYGYANSVMPALGRADDRTMIDVMQKVNVAIVNPWFLLLGFLGAPVLAVVAGAMYAGRGDVSVVAIAGAAFNVLGTAMTFAVNIPLNNELDRAGEANRISDPAPVRDRFESRWVRWNVARAVVHGLAFMALTSALAL